MLYKAWINTLLSRRYQKGEVNSFLQLFSLHSTKTTSGFPLTPYPPKWLQGQPLLPQKQRSSWMPWGGCQAAHIIFRAQGKSLSWEQAHTCRHRGASAAAHPQHAQGGATAVCCIAWMPASYRMNYAFGIAPVSIFVVLRWPCAAGGLDSIFFQAEDLKYFKFVAWGWESSLCYKTRTFSHCYERF